LQECKEVYSNSREKGEKESINAWTNDFSEASVVRMIPQKQGLKRTYPIDYQFKNEVFICPHPFFGGKRETP